MITKCSTVLAAIMVTLGSSELAEAQNASNNTGTAPVAVSAPAPITPAFHTAATRGGQVKNGGSKTAPGAVATAAPVAPAVVGWNYVHATVCLGYWDGANTWLYVYPQEGGYWFTSNLALQNVLEPQCSQGNWVAFNVYNTNGNLWNQVATWNFK